MNTSILLITFNRPEHTRRVLERILEAEPLHLYVFQDGARIGNENDSVKCQQVRDVVYELITNTSTTLHTFYSDKNLGCGAGPMTGISWVFDNVEQGIVMEDDCLAHPDFFGYCEELLNRYKENPEVMFINSTLYDGRWTCANGESYGFSRYMVTGAWASWREVWQGFDLDLKSLNCKAFRRQVFKLTKSWDEANWWYFKSIEMQRDNSKKSYWDYQCSVLLFLKEAITIHPSVNLISNIGFDAEGTHTLNNDGRGDKPVYPILPLHHPYTVVVDAKRDLYCFSKVGKRGFWEQWISFLYNTSLYSNGVLHSILMFYKRLKRK